MSRHPREDGMPWVRASIKEVQYFKYDGKIMQFADFNKPIGELISLRVHSLPKHPRSYVCFMDNQNERHFACYLRHKHSTISMNCAVSLMY